MLSMYWRSALTWANRLILAGLFVGLVTQSTRLRWALSENAQLTQQVGIWRASAEAQARTEEGAHALQRTLDDVGRDTVDALRVHAARSCPCVSASATSTRALNAAARARAPLPDTFVDGSALLQLGGECQRAVALVHGWQQWYATVSARP